MGRRLLVGGVLAGWLFSSPPVRNALTCCGDCNGDAAVTIDELVVSINVALGTATIDACPYGDCLCAGPKEICTIAFMPRVVNAALYGCPR